MGRLGQDRLVVRGPSLAFLKLNVRHPRNGRVVPFVILNELKDLTLDWWITRAHLCDQGSSARSFACAREDRYLARYGFEHAPDGFGKNLLAVCVRMNSIGQIH